MLYFSIEVWYNTIKLKEGVPLLGLYIIADMGFTEIFLDSVKIHRMQEGYYPVPLHLLLI